MTFEDKAKKFTSNLVLVLKKTGYSKDTIIGGLDEGAKILNNCNLSAPVKRIILQAIEDAKKEV